MKISAFSATADHIASEIVITAGVSVPYDPNSKDKQPPIHFTQALWDTGATNCVITPTTAKALNLKPIGQTEVHTANGIVQKNVYLVNIYLPNNLALIGRRVTECTDNAGMFGMIIGMDVITMGDFAITNQNGKTTVSFRIPSVQTINFVKDGNSQVIAPPKIHRNQPCPCGSRKKFKNCCEGLNPGQNN